MNRYRDYMDRIAAPASLADKVLEGKRSRRTRPALAAGVLAACCLVAAVGGWQLWQGRALTEPDPTAGVAGTPQMSQQAAQGEIIPWWWRMPLEDSLTASPMCPAMITPTVPAQTLWWGITPTPRAGL